MFACLVCLLVAVLLASSSEAKLDQDGVSISHVTALLPFNPPSLPGSSLRKPVRFKLEASGGCFSWQSSHPEVLELLEISQGNSCERGSTSVWVSPNYSTDSERFSVWVWAEEIRSHERVECEVFVDRIHRLEVLTSTRVVNVGDSESIDVQAFDQQNNVFSTLAGLPFEWSNSNPTALQSLRFFEAGIDVLPIYREMEKASLLSDRYPVKGSLTGKAHISARLLAPYENVDAVSVTFSVVEPLYLSLSTVSILPATDVLLELETRFRHSHPTAKKQHRRRISMPSPQYSWSSTDAAVVSVDELGRASGLKVGRARVLVQDNNFSQHQKHVDVRVVEAGFLIGRVYDLDAGVLAQLNDGVWQLVRGRRYSIGADLLGTDRSRVYRGHNIQFSKKLSGPVVKFVNEKPNVLLSMAADEAGAGSVEIALDTVSSSLSGQSYTPSKPIATLLRFIVAEPVQFVDYERVSLPWVGAKDPTSVIIKATGGSGRFLWSSADASVAHVSGTTGVVSTVRPGQTSVSVCDALNVLNCAEMPLLVSLPSGLRHIPSHVEVEVSQLLPLRFAVTDSSGHSFTNCSNLRAIFSVDDGDAISIVSRSLCMPSCVSDASVSCFEIKVGASSSGVSAISASLELDGVVEPEGVAITSFEPLRLEPSKAILATGTSTQFFWTGGPLRWDPSHDLESSVITGKAGVVSVAKPDLLSSEKTFNVTCHDVHEQVIEVRVNNPVTSVLPHPVVASASASLRCFPPLRLSPVSLRLPIGIERVVSVLDAHPLTTDVIFSSDDASIASISSSGVVIGHNLGTTVLRANASDALFHSVAVVVEFGGFKIVSARDTLLIGRSTLLQIHGVDGELPDHVSFESVHCDWSLDSTSVASLSDPLYSDLSLGNSSYLGVRLLGREAGVITVRASIRVDGDERVFTAERQLHILAPLLLKSSRNVLLPLSSKSSGIDTSLDRSSSVLSYDVFSPSGVTLLQVGDVGVIHTGDVSGDGVVVVTATDHGHQQSESVLFSVRQVAEIAVQGRGDIGPLCVGQNRTVSVSLKDDIGRVFNAIDGWESSIVKGKSKFSALQFSSSKPDVLQLHRLSGSASADGVVAALELSGMSEGSSVLKVALPDDQDGVEPFYLYVKVVSSSHCKQQVTYRVTLPMRLTPHNVPLSEDARQQWTQQFSVDVAKALGVAAEAIKVVTVNACIGSVEFDVDSTMTTGSSVNVASKAISQAGNRDSVLMAGVITRQVAISESLQPSLRAFNGAPATSTSWTLLCPTSTTPQVTTPTVFLSDPFYQVLMAFVLGTLLLIVFVFFGSFSHTAFFDLSLGAVGGPHKLAASPGRPSPSNLQLNVAVPPAAGPGVQSPFEARAKRFRRESHSELMRSFTS